MTSPRRGAAFSLAGDGDLRHDLAARAAWSRGLGIEPEWATVRQIHGAAVVEANAPGDRGEADAILTFRPELPLAVFTADCVGVVLGGAGAVGVAHAGWRGAAAGVVGALAEAMSDRGGEPVWGVIGPSIGPCCFEVGSEVADLFPGHISRTTEGGLSVDLGAVVAAQVPGVEIQASGICSRHSDAAFSYRRDRTSSRMAMVGWLP
ncbi:MAG TPA: polyphenol oxidase family protein [Acidimicrobiia bacterium]|nr:polyphenol oxidase family protein [Acidimicrobiia bacterium]